MTSAVLSVGGNLGDPAAAVRAAQRHFAPWLLTVSPVFRTPPWGPVPQDDFANAVLLVDDPTAGAVEWLARAHAAEDAAGRTREVRWGPRSLDVDVVAVRDGADEVTSDDPRLTLPHPRAAERAFVLVPWLAADPDARLGGRTVAELVAALPPGDVAAVRPWDAGPRTGKRP